MADKKTKEDVGCYCASKKKVDYMIQCESCKKFFHPTCLKSGVPSSLEGDVFFHLTCTSCATDGEEKCKRMKLQWLQVVWLSLYNLQLKSTGKCGYFRWKEHVAAFIEKHWFLFFGSARKRSQTWHGTVAGTLSAGCPRHFRSGTHMLGESGWWSLIENKPPGLNTLTPVRPPKRPRPEAKSEGAMPKIEGLRSRRAKHSIQAAMELKARRDTTHEAKEMRKVKLSVSPPPIDAQPVVEPVAPPIAMETSCEPANEEPGEVKMETEEETEDPNISGLNRSLESDSSLMDQSTSSRMSLLAELTDQNSQMSLSQMSANSSKSEQWLTESDLTVQDVLPEFLLKDDGEIDSDLEIDPCSLSPNHPESPDHMTSSADPLPRVEDILLSLESKSKLHETIDQMELTSESNPTDIDEASRATTPSFKNVSFQIKEEIVEETMEPHIISSILAPETSEKTLKRTPSSKSIHEEKWTDSESEAGDTEEKGKEKEKETKKVAEEKEKPEQHKKKKKKATVVVKEDKEDQKDSPKPSAQPKFLPMTNQEEKQLLKKLKSYGKIVSSNHEANRLKRKLIVRQLKREKGVALFDLDAFMYRVTGGQQFMEPRLPELPSKQLFQPLLPSEAKPTNNTSKKEPSNMPTSRSNRADFRVLDRFQRRQYAYQSQQGVSFLNRLVGTEDDQLQPICSPHTARMLKPFIRRDSETRPQKLKLLMEIKAYPHRSEPDWVSPPPYPIDYCYVRPQHIPSVNTLCGEFFWPGIDVSECLQYPDFSCVVLYRKFVIGFAFMVPDVKYNEAYISFLFTHPEWRGAGIAQFMLYHLIQTCMGKDVTLHVSASNPAMLLYQKFGFKPEEFILDFYDKYYPEDSQECRHAFFLRLRR